MGVFDWIGNAAGDAWDWAKDAVTPDKTPGDAKYKPDQANFQYGLGAPGSYANQQSDAYYQRQQQLQALGATAQGRGTPGAAYTASTGQGYLNGADAEGRRQQLQALGGLQSYAQQGPGPSAAQAQLQQGLNQGQAQQYGMARSQPGGGGAALRNAAFNSAGMAGQTNSQAAQLRAQEDASWRQQQLQALGGVQQGAGALRGADQGMAQARAGQENYEANAANQFATQQQQIQLASRAQNDALTLGAGQQSMGYDAMRNGLAQQNTGANMAYEQARLAGAQQAAGNFKQQQDQWMGYVQGGLGLFGSALGAAGAASDVRAKKDIERADVLAALGGRSPRGSGGAPPAASAAAYPTPSAPDTAALDQAYSREGGAPNLRPAQGYEYSYRDPQRHGEGRYVGPMAQNLEHLPGVVQPAEDGTKMIDTSRLSLANTAAVSDQQRRMDELERRQQLMALGFRPQQPDTDALDAAYLRGSQP